MTSKIKLLLAILLVGMCSTYAQNKKQMTRDEKKVLEVIERMTSSFEKKDIDKVMECYEPEALVMFDPEKPVSDPDVLKSMFEGMAAASPKFVYSGHQVFVSGDIAIHIAPWKMTAKTPEGENIEQDGLSVAVLRKQSNGEWLILIDNPHGQVLLNQ